MVMRLNLGCGSRFNSEWTNVDFVSTGKGVIVHDLRKGIPFQDSSVEVVYNSHLLEHFPKAEALPFLRECYRVLKPGGIIRIAVPDLERIAKVYLQTLEKATQGEEKWPHNYEWIMLEMYDQTVRELSGGEMASYLHQKILPNKEFVLERIGIEGKKIIEDAERKRSSAAVQTTIRILNHFIKFLRNPYILRELLIKLLLGGKYKILQLGRFRRGGEIHLWMYDRYSLGQILIDAGFKNPLLFDHAESQIHGWRDFHLDTAPDGTAYKPDSLYMEGIKP